MSNTVTDDSIATPSPSREASPARDIVGWVVLVWVAIWSVAYFQSALVHRFPRLLGWAERLF